MQIGIHAPLLREDIPLYRDLGVTWTKYGADLDDGAAALKLPELDSAFDLAAEIGLECVVDLRTSVPFIEQTSCDIQMQLAQAGALEMCPEGATRDEQLAVIARNNRIIRDRAYQPLYAKITETVARYRDRCHNWEFWGEAACPWVSGRCFGDNSRNYPYLLRGVYAAVKAADPYARVWTGGNGMDLQCAFYYACLDQEAGPCFDVCNLHPYFMQIRDRGNAEMLLEREYTRLRAALQEKGNNQPFAATEWGYPTHSADSIDIEPYLRSNVVPARISQLYWSDAEAWFEGDLAAMERHGFEVVIVHAMRDTEDGDGYWGARCGLLDLQGRRKNVWSVVQRWAWKGRQQQA